MRGFIVLFFLFYVSFLQAQIIKGKVTDAEHEAIEFASIRLFSTVDSTVVSGVYTDADGFFELSGMASATYYLKISYTGFETYIKSAISVTSEKTVVDLGNITLIIPKSLELEEATVVGSLDALKAGIDKKIYSVEEDISIQGGSVNDVLNNIPSIDVDEEGNISLRGDGNVTILIDGRPSALALGDGQNLLDALPSNSIERVEVVTNPSAKYDPDGTSGIINIVLKKNKRKGINGIVNGTGATDNLAQGNAGVSYRDQHWNLYMNYSLDYYEGYRNNLNQLYQVYDNDSTNFLDQSREGTDYKMTNTLVLGTDYYLDERNTIGFSVTGSTGDRIRTGDLENILYDDDSLIIDRWERISRDPRKHNNFDANLNYAHKFDDQKGEMSFVANQSMGIRDISGFYNQQTLQSDGSSTGVAALDQQLFNDRRDAISTIQGDMSYIFDSIRARIEFGAKYIHGSEYNNTYSEAKDTLTGVFAADTLAIYEYRYTEDIASIYGMFGQEIGKLKYQVGFRGEIANQLPELLSTNESFPIRYMNVYPSAHVKYEIGKKSEFSLSYSKRINRPSSNQLNPFKSYANPLSVRTGNPELNPEYIDSYDFGYSFTGNKTIFTFSAFHRRTKDVIQRVRLYYADNSSVTSFQNVDQSISTGLESILILKPWKWMKNTISVNASFVNYEDDDTQFDWNNDGFNWSMKYIGSFDFWKKTATAQVNFQYRSPMVRPQGIVQPRTGIDLSVEKRFFDRKLSVGAKVTDIFNTKGFYLELTQPGIWQVSQYKWLTRRFYISCSYRFGKYEDKKMRKNFDGDGEE